MGAKSFIITGSILIVLGLALGVGWLFGCIPLVNNVADKKLRQALVVDSPSAEGYDDWVQGIAHRNPNYYVYYMWNLTNVDEVINNQAAPNYSQVGPFYYRYYWYNLNATFSDNGNKVEYSLLEDYIFDPTQSVSDPTTTYITNISPPYLGILMQSQGETNMVVGASCPQINIFIDWLTGPYIDIVSSQYTPTILPNVTSNIVTLLLPYHDNDVELATAYFYEMWANATDLPKQPDDNTVWANMLVGMQSNTPHTPTNISMESVKMMFDESVTLSLLNTSADAVMTWYNAFIDNNGAEAKTLRDLFSIDAEQLRMVAHWRLRSFTPGYVTKVLLDIAQQNQGTNDIKDIGWVQYGTGAFTQPSVVEFFGPWVATNFSDPFEAFNQDDMSAFDVPTLKKFYAGPAGILDLQEFQDFMNALQVMPPAKPNLTRWDVNIGQGFAFLSYVMGIVVEDYTAPLITNLVDQGYGLVTTKSVDYWLWRCFDPIVDFLAGPANASCTLQFNHTAQPRSQIWTGKDDIKKMNKYIKWRNQTHVGVWKDPVAVEGCAENGQFALKLQEGDDLTVFDESFTKTVTLNNVGKVTFKGIDALKYVFNNSAFDASELYTNTIQGFANESAANQGAPVYLSNWDFYYVNNSYANATNMHPNKNDVTTLIVEPFTGNTIKADMKLQVNFLYPANGSQWIDLFTDSGYQFMPDNTMYPVLKAWQKSEVGEEDTKKLISKLKPLKPSFLTTLRFSVVGVGAFIVLVGVLLVVIGVRKNNRDGYTHIQ